MKLRAIVLLAALSACSGGQEGGVLSKAVGAVRGAAASGPATSASPPRLTRAALDQTGLAAIRVAFEGSGGGVLMAVARNAQYVTFADQFRRSVTLEAARGTGMRGFGIDLLGVETGSGDAVAVARSPSRWPATSERRYVIPKGDMTSREIAVSCEITRGDEKQVEILERFYRVVAFAEVCTGEGIAFRNIYEADYSTGFVWRSVQWVGPELPRLVVEVLEPFTD